MVIFMNEFKLETYEWDDTWIEKTENTEAERILYIGDSISRGTREVLHNTDGIKVLIDGYASSKALDNPYFFDMLSAFVKQEKRLDAVLFNNGLHGFHLTDGEYAELYEKLLDKLSELFGDTRLYLLLTTAVNGELNETVISRNGAVKKIAEKRGLPIIDLYSVSAENAEYHIPDGIHFTDEGYRILGREILKCLEEDGIC